MCGRAGVSPAGQDGGDCREVMAVRPEKGESDSEDDDESAVVPTEKEVENHNRTHMPYRNWCPHCIRVKGRDLDHRRAGGGERNIPEYSFD